MKYKPKLLETRINEVKQIVENSDGFTSKRLKIIYSNTEHRIKDISGIQIQHIASIEKITSDCINILDKSGVEASLVEYKVKLDLLLSNILSDVEETNLNVK
ncbi:MAG: hypothetical protein ACK4IX_02135 [Candidatus Sericytochromatia bacterium]